MSTTSALAVLLTALSLNPVEDVAAERVDVIELNHFYDDRGRLVFDQIIFYDWSVHESSYQVRDWRLLKSPAQIPHRNWPEGTFIAVWHDSGVLRRVEAKQLHESWTQYDPELVNRTVLPKEQRRLLRKAILPVQTARSVPVQPAEVAERTAAATR